LLHQDLDGFLKIDKIIQHPFDIVREEDKVMTTKNLTLIISKEDKIMVSKPILITFKKLQAAGLGFLIIGRNGKPTRFKWNHSGKVRLELENKVFNIKPELNNVVAITPAVALKKLSMLKRTTYPLVAFTSFFLKTIPQIAGAHIKDTLVSIVSLKDEVEAIVELPISMTKEEMKNISNFVASVVQSECRMFYS